MKLSSLITICIVIILYIHVIFELKTSNEMDVYELEMDTRRLEEICNYKQPVVINYDARPCIPSQLTESIMVYDTYHNGVPLSIDKANDLFKGKGYGTYQNNLTDSMHLFLPTDIILRPPMCVMTRYDIMFGSEGYTTRLQYSTANRTYLVVSQGSITVKLAPSITPLDKTLDYETHEVVSSINPWTEKKAFLEMTIGTGRMLFVPAYWWNSIRLEKDACVCVFQYRTCMNVLSTLPNFGIDFLQQCNTITKIFPRVST